MNKRRRCILTNIHKSMCLSYQEIFTMGGALVDLSSPKNVRNPKLKYDTA